MLNLLKLLEGSVVERLEKVLFLQSAKNQFTNCLSIHRLRFNDFFSLLLKICGDEVIEGSGKSKQMHRLNPFIFGLPIRRSASMLFSNFDVS